uniref:MalT-like TPR region domain-containing protein n=1 Tax=Pseudo-nitzschia delicatissima TaxID=44447 RepID=A0A7S0T7Y4_9STRA|mmetsp:Transcript_1094/g.2521  ORF Transcript_1094/g.2521 Transcript_1094/m.2521 type:complete len:761 (+) Transcript_1094:26-2308(+)
MVVVDNQRGLGSNLTRGTGKGKISKGNNGNTGTTKSFRFDRLDGGISEQIIADRKKYIEMKKAEEDNIVENGKDKESLTPSDSVSDNFWYDGVLSSFFGGNSCEDRNDMKGMIICGSPNYDSDSILRNAMPIQLECGEQREDIDDDSTSDGTMDPLGKDLGEDLKSLPSVHGRIIPVDDDTPLDDIENWPGTPGGKHSFARNIKPREISKHESVESLVEKKIKNLKSERLTREISPTIPYLKQKIFPMTAGRDDSDYSRSNDQARGPDSALEARRKFLARELRSAIAKYGRFDVRCTNITAALGDLYDENEEYKQALKLHKDVISVYSASLGDDDKKTLDARLRLGEVQENSGDMDSAINTFFNVMNMLKALKGETDPEAMEVYTRIAGCLRKKGKYDLAIKILKRALKSYREVLGDTHPTVSVTVDAVASLYITIGDYGKASAILEEVVKLKAATLGLRSKEVASSLSELATSYECAEQYSKAMKNLKKAYKIYAEIDGETGEKSILMLERIALVYQATAQYKKAAIAYLGVLRGRKRVLGDAHPTVADTYFHLGVSLRESNQRDKAFKCIKQALNIYVGEGKDIHDLQMIAEVMHELAVIYKANNNLTDAIKTFQQEIAVRRKLGQAEYPFIAQSLNHIGVTEFEIKNFNRALNYFSDALAIYKKKREETPGIDGAVADTEYAEALYNTGLVFEALRNKQKARIAFIEAAGIFKENGHPKSHPHYSKIVGKLKRLGIVGPDGSTPTNRDNPINMIDVA